MNSWKILLISVIALSLLVVAGCPGQPGYYPDRPLSYEQDKEYADEIVTVRGNLGKTDKVIAIELRLIRQLLERLVEVEEAKLRDEHSD